MPNSGIKTRVASGEWQVPASFGRREIRCDPLWEHELADFLRSSHSKEELSELFIRFGAGQGTFQVMMRRTVMRAMCRAVGHDIQISQNISLIHPETMELGDCVFIGTQAIIQGRLDGTCRIGSHVWIGPQAFLDARDLSLDDYVGWGPGAKLLGSEHTGVPVDEPLIRTDLLVKKVSVGFGSDIGMNACLLPGVTIGAHAVVGAGAVVTHNVPDYAIVAGVPARIIGDRRNAK